MARGKAAIPLDLPCPAGLSTGNPQSKQECIADALRDAILKRLLPGDSPLPSSRTLAARWGVAICGKIGGGAATGGWHVGAQ